MELKVLRLSLSVKESLLEMVSYYDITLLA